ncbi:protein CWC15 homolog B-like [Papaver somniferum]|uniref:protein CWC15 homolog B-like n=1 Tax=Papaver somniferum TaxID=3469 RepID=UPI000E704D51|nr:protein CWC15 homolog B-like [Papaver somniferum]
MNVDDSDKYSYSESDDDDSDDTDTLMAELVRIKKERLEDWLRKERLEQEEEIKVKEAKLNCGNPLVSNAASFTIKRRWDDDVTFKSQSRVNLKHPSASSTTRSGMTSIENSCKSI